MTECAFIIILLTMLNNVSDSSIILMYSYAVFKHWTIRKHNYNFLESLKIFLNTTVIGRFTMVNVLTKKLVIIHERGIETFLW